MDGLINISYGTVAEVGCGVLTQWGAAAVTAMEIELLLWCAMTVALCLPCNGVFSHKSGEGKTNDTLKFEDRHH